MNFKLLTTAFFLVLTSACAFNSGENEDNKSYLDARDKLQSDFAPVLGTYQGFLTIVGSTARDENSTLDYQIPLELSIYSSSGTGGSDANGQPNVLPVLMVRYRQMDKVRPDEILRARFIKENGDLYAAPSTVVETYVSIDGRLNGNVISGVVGKLTGGSVGNFTVTRISDATSPVDETQDLIRRKTALYETLKGTYEGRVTAPPGSGKKSFPVRIVMTIVPVVVNNKVVDVGMRGLYRRPDFTADPSAGERTLEITYETGTIPARMVMTSRGGTPAIPNAYTMDIVGTIVNGHFEGKSSDRFGDLGTIVLDKKSSVQRKR